MNTAAALANDLAELKDVMFAIEVIRAQDPAAQPESVPALSVRQRKHLRADSRARAWIPAHLIDTLR